MAAVTQAPPRAAAAAGGFFGFLKDGVVVSTRNRGLFMPLVALHAARSMAFYLAKTLAFRSFAATVDLDAYHDGTLSFFALVGEFAAGHWRLVHAGVAYLAAHVTLGLAIDAATASAAVAASSRHGDQGHSHTITLASLLPKLKGPMVTALYGNTVLWAMAGVVLSVVPAAGFIPDIAILVMLFLLVLFTFTFFYYGVVCAVAVVASAAEPDGGGGGLRAAAAVRRARRLMRGGRKVAQAMVYALAAWALNKAVWKMHATTLALYLPHSSISNAAFPLDGVVVYLLLGALKVLCTATITAYYFDCRRTEEGNNKAGHTE